ncbi:helix-turn-helix domain-containing protein [Streptomyces sp. SudanB182_2057]|uniref:helix-turn-helix domain-containing protein n=1 Tax=Streptomyces sp. SudanB182_2057 TaxID=3035281 RepID=UPI003F57EE8A
MSNPVSDEARVIPLRPAPARPEAPASEPAAREPLWRDLVGEVLRRERREQERTLKDVADAARISLPYLSEIERGRKEASSEVLAAAAHALGLSLGDLLARVHGELSRRTAGHHRTAAAPHRSYRGLCLAA